MERHWHTENPLNCPVVETLNIISGKWKPMILHMLITETMRFGELQRQLPSVSQKVLTQQLRELESDGVISRTVYPEVPPRVEYALTDSGVSLIPALDELHRWGQGRDR